MLMGSWGLVEFEKKLYTLKQTLINTGQEKSPFLIEGNVKQNRTRSGWLFASTHLNEFA